MSSTAYFVLIRTSGLYASRSRLASDTAPAVEISIFLALVSRLKQNTARSSKKAYENGQLRGRQLIEARRLVERRAELGPGVAHGSASKGEPAISPSSLVRTYQKEVARKKQMVVKAEYSQNRLLFVIEALRSLFGDENFVNLLRAEGLESLPASLADRINLQGAL